MLPTFPRALRFSPWKRRTVPTRAFTDCRLMRSNDDGRSNVTFSDQLLARLLDEFPEIVVVLNNEGKLIWANNRAEALFNRTLESAIGISVLDFIHPDDLEIVLRSLETVQGKDVGVPLEIRVRIDTEWRLIELIGRPVSWFEDGAIFCSIRDLTERRRFEVAGDDVARFRSIVEHRPFANIVAELDRPALRAALESAIRVSSATQPFIHPVRLLRRGSQEMTSYELAIVSLIDDPTVGSLVVSAHDVSGRVLAEKELENTLRELRETFSLLNATLESTADGLLVVGNDRTISSFNGQFAQMWRLPANVVAKRNDVNLIDFVTDQLVDPAQFRTRIDELYAAPEAESIDILEFKDGRFFRRLSKPQYVSGQVVGRVWSFSDITAQKKLESELAHLAFHDSLTGLANRALFQDRVTQAVARSERNGKYVAVLFLDLDNFKYVNDSLGHTAGDELLKAVGAALTGSLRRSDTAARLGGDEFAVLVEDIDSHAEVLGVARRTIQLLRQPMNVGDHELSTTVSIGVTFGYKGHTSEQLLRNADLAMYLAKSKGKDRIEEFQDEMHVAVVERLELEADLRRAVLAEELRVHYQPIFNLDTGGIIGFEALVRWQHPTQGLLQPITFIPFAEEIGLIHLIDRFVLGEACAQVRLWQDQGLVGSDLVMSVNLSARELADNSIRESVGLSLLETGFEPANLILEITESAIMKDLKSTIRNLESLKSLGLRIAVDDFGTGFSSLTHLEQLPIDILKVDRSFVATIDSDDHRARLTPAIVQLAHTLGLTAIAEGVEQFDQVPQLRELGCTLAQGYFLGVPLSADETEVLLRSLAP